MSDITSKEALFAKREEHIKNYGYTIQGVFASQDGAEPPFSYTIGLLETANHPEIMMVGFDVNLMASIIRNLAKEILAGKVYENDARVNKVIESYPVALRDVPAAVVQEHCLGALRRGIPHKSVKVLQMFLPDVNGKFPWDDGVDPKYAGWQMAFQEMRKKPTLRPLN
ncbi:DUF4262 domain-containing protein [Thalassospira xianhensis]|nr:DUF4262 domain-containing protein [Thalassospira xianhensis]